MISVNSQDTAFSCSHSCTDDKASASVRPATVQPFGSTRSRSSESSRARGALKLILITAPRMKRLIIATPLE
jgi:hypothetical protein